ncbi:MAG: pyrroloquinoline quinone biosynthesis protein PqqB [Granulosicoccus sp.]
MKLKVLGSAAGGGYPQWNCNCPMCAGVRTGSIDATARTQSSIAVSSDGIDWVLFNTSPDILTQIQQCGILQPGRSLRDTGIRSIVLLDAQIDHTTGLLMLREHQKALPVWCTGPVREDLSEGNPLFRVLSHYCTVDWHEIALDGETMRIPGADTVSFQALPLTSNAPPYSPHRDQPVTGDTLGMLMHDTASDKRIFYAPGLGEMEGHVWAAMNEADIVLVDGTMWTDDEMISRGASAKTARSMGHLPQTGPGGMIEWLDKLPASTRKILIHINNTNPVLQNDGKERQHLEAHGIELAEDGLEIDC